MQWLRSIPLTSTTSLRYTCIDDCRAGCVIVRCRIPLNLNLQVKGMDLLTYTLGSYSTP